MQLFFYGLYLFLAVYSAGNITTLQIQHYNIYSFIGKDQFKNYMRANNKAAWIPSLIPAFLLLVVNIYLVFSRPSFMSITEAIFSLVLNIVAVTSTVIGQRKVQRDMAEMGYNEEKISFLVATNWIRMFMYITMGIMAVAIVMNAVS